MDCKLTNEGTTIFNENYTICIDGVDIEKLENNSTYCISFSIDDYTVDDVSRVLQGLNNWMKENDRNIIFIAKTSEIKMEKVDNEV